MQSELRELPVGTGAEPPRRLHPLTLLFAALDEGQAFALPAILGGAWAADGHMARMLGWIVILLVVPSVLWAVAEYLRFRYVVTGASLVVDSGVWRREHRVIPLARIQNIDLRRNLLQRMLGVAEFHVETAGGESSEAALSVLGIRDAEALRTQLLALRAGAEESQIPRRSPVAKLSTWDLLLAGATANEAGVIAAVLIGAVELAYEFRITLPLPGLDWRALIFEQSTAELVTGAAVVLFVLLLLGWGFSVLGAVLNYSGFTLERTGSELHKRYGSLVRREATVPLERVQVIRVEESLLRRPLGLVALKIETAATAPGGGQHRGVEAFVPLAQASDAGRLVAEVFSALDYDALGFQPVNPWARRHAFGRYAFVLLVISAALVAMIGAEGLWGLASLPVAYAAAHLHYRSLGYTISEGFLVARGGWLNRITWVVPLRKVQTLHESATLLQRRHGLASLVVDTAAGGARVPDLPAQTVRNLLEQLGRGLAASAHRVDRPAARLA
jgi:putative membrane protein